MGSEPGMGWNWIVNLAPHCELFVISEGEFKEQCEQWCLGHPDVGQHIHWYWNPVPQSTRDKCWNQGDWSFYILYQQWQRKTADIAIDICKTEQIDVLHQLNMVGFREPGMLYLVNDERKKEGLASIPIIWGPSAGFGSIPFTFMWRGGLKFTAFYLLKNLLNVIELVFHPRVRRMIAESDALVAATPDMKRGIEKYYSKQVYLNSEVGCYLSESNDWKKTFSDQHRLKLLWVGRFIFTKQLDLALQTIQKLNGIEGLELHIVGTGITDDITERMHQRAEELHVDYLCHWHGRIPNAEVHQLMKESDIFFFTSIFEATSTVILEAISNRLPIVCFDRCGFGAIVDDTIGRKVSCKDPRQAVSDFCNVIQEFNTHRDRLLQMSQNCLTKQKDLSWDYKMEQILKLYQNIRK